MGVTPLSLWPWIDRPASGLYAATYRPIQTRFPFASPKKVKLAATYNSLTHYTKGTRSP